MTRSCDAPLGERPKLDVTGQKSHCGTLLPINAAHVRNPPFAPILTADLRKIKFVIFHTNPAGDMTKGLVSNLPVSLPPILAGQFTPETQERVENF